MQRHHGLANAQRITIIWPTPPLLLVPCLGAVKPFRILRLHKGRWRRLCRCGEEPVGHRTNFPDRDSHLLRIPRLLAQGRRRCGQVVALRNEGSIRRFRGGELRTIRVRCWVLRFATAALRVAGSWDELLPGCVCRILAQLQQHHEVRVQRERLVHHQVGKATGGVRQEGVPCKQSSERQVVVKGTQLAAAAFQSVREATTPAASCTWTAAFSPGSPPCRRPELRRDSACTACRRVAGLPGSRPSGSARCLPARTASRCSSQAVAEPDAHRRWPPPPPAPLPSPPPGRWRWTACCIANPLPACSQRSQRLHHQSPVGSRGAAVGRGAQPCRPLARGTRSAGTRDLPCESCSSEKRPAIDRARPARPAC
eukprot:scaffold642_cov232-Pinguiococcus_pyrenoidosus.AAC.13